MNSIVIGFTGGTGSGKTTLAQRLNEVFKNNSVIIKQDSYYKDFPDKTFEERVQINYDHPDSFDMERFTDDVRILRRIIRDVKERGRSLDSVVLQYLTTVKPMHERFIEPEKKRADIIVPEGGYNEVAFDMIVDAIKHKLN